MVRGEDRGNGSWEHGGRMVGSCWGENKEGSLKEVMFGWRTGFSFSSCALFPYPSSSKVCVCVGGGLPLG